MSYPPQVPYQPGAAPVPPAPGQTPPAETQYSVPSNPTMPMPAAPAGQPYAAPAAQPGYAPPAAPGYAPASYDQGFAAGGYPPASAPPFSGPPLSGPMVSGPPMSGPPAGYLAPPPKGKPTVLILAIVAGLLFLLGGVMTGLFVAKNNELDSTRTQVAARDKTIADRDGELARVKDNLERVQDELDEANQTLTGTQNDRDRVEKEKAAIVKCMNLVNDILGAAAAGDSAEVRKLDPQVTKACDEAEKYL
jgi:hypothetical protein